MAINNSIKNEEVNKDAVDDSIQEVKNCMNDFIDAMDAFLEVFDKYYDSIEDKIGDNIE